MIQITIPVTTDCCATVFQSPDNKHTCCVQVWYNNRGWMVGKMTRASSLGTKPDWYVSEENEETVLNQTALNFATDGGL